MEQIKLKDDFGFLDNINNWNNHRIFLLLGLELTKSGTVLELGCGDGSTNYLRNYCENKNRKLISYDYNKEYATKFNAIHVTEWEFIKNLKQNFSVVLIDESPGEERKINIQRLIDKTKIFVLHDSEPEADHGYQFSTIFGLFKYKLDFKTNGAWTTMLSNSVNLDEYKNKMINDKFFIE